MNAQSQSTYYFFYNCDITSNAKFVHNLNKLYERTSKSKHNIYLYFNFQYGSEIHR